MTTFEFIEHKTDKTVFKELKEGDTFMIDFSEDEKDTVFMKTSQIEGEGTGIDLSSGAWREFHLTTPVLPIRTGISIKHKNFENLRIGETFMVDSGNKHKEGVIYIKIWRVTGQGSAMSLKTGEHERFEWADSVIPVDTTIQIHKD